MSKVAVDTEFLRYLWTPDLDPLFWRGGRTGAVSAWFGHIPFAHWIVRVLKPNTLVELGTHNGVSYSAFCEAVVRDGLNTRCYGVDTWKGDEQTGHYGEEVYQDLRRFHDGRYGSFSELLRCTFDEALPHFSNSSVDLLHIDGRHTYEAVRHDFEQWLPKLSESAVILLHDTNVRERDFGVWRLWEELSTDFPSFEFLHGHGLGVLATGQRVPPEITGLCSLREAEQIHTVRHRFSLLGEYWRLLYQSEHLLADIGIRDASVVSLEAERARLQDEVARRNAAEEQLKVRDTRISSLEAEMARLRADAARQSEAELQLRARAAQRTIRARTEAASAITKAAAALQTEQARAEALEALTKSAQPERGPGQAEAEIATRLGIPRVRLLYISGEPDTPGNIYRVVRYVEAANAAGIEASWIPLDRVTEHSEEIAQANILFIWRAAWDERIAHAVETARRAGAQVVFDIDDLLIDPDLVRVDVIDGIRTGPLTEQQWQQHCSRFQATMAAADYCIAPTEELAMNIRRFSHPTLVLPNGFDCAAYKSSRRAIRRRRLEKPDEAVRIGYAGGTPSHQRDFGVAAEAVGRVLRDRPHCRLVLFRSRGTQNGVLPTLNIEEFPSFYGIEDRIEWRDIVPLSQLPEEIAGFDINIAPLEVGNPFCEAKSELKFFEAVLVDVPTVASPTGPYRRAIQDGVTGFLADNPDDWYASLLRLVDDPGLRKRVARAAHNDVLWRYGPLRRADTMLSAIPQLREDRQSAARAFALELHRGHSLNPGTMRIPETEVVFEADQLGDAEVTIVVSMHNHAGRIEETLESVRGQTQDPLDLVVVDNASTDTSIPVTLSWAQRHASRFNRLVVLRNRANAGPGLTRNAGIDAAETPLVLSLDADNRLLPECVATCLPASRHGGAAFAYSRVRQLGDGSKPENNFPFEAAQLISGGHTGMIALVLKEAWAGVGGYRDVPSEHQDFDFLFRLTEFGLCGSSAGDAPLVRYRVHGNSASGSSSDNNPSVHVLGELEKRHGGLDIAEQSPLTGTDPTSKDFDALKHADD